MKVCSILVLLSGLLFLSSCKQEGLEVSLAIKEHRFVPDIVNVPAKTKLILVIHNQDSTAEEFESFDLKRERIIPPNGIIRVPVAPLNVGEYEFFGEFHPETCQGKLIVNEIRQENQ